MALAIIGLLVLVVVALVVAYLIDQNQARMAPPKVPEPVKEPGQRTKKRRRRYYHHRPPSPATKSELQKPPPAVRQPDTSAQPKKVSHEPRPSPQPSQTLPLKPILVAVATFLFLAILFMIMIPRNRDHSDRQTNSGDASGVRTSVSDRP